MSKWNETTGVLAARNAVARTSGNTLSE